MLLFKYVSPDAVAKVLESADELALRFGLPKTYNDPYELFLEPDSPLEREEVRAFYKFFLGKVVEAPVSCFSRRPDSVVMWAHYCREGSGICLAFDEESLINQFPFAYVGDITYSDNPAKIDSGIIEYAYTTGKRRHTFALLSTGHRAAYFTKRTDWRYEEERRVVVTPDAVEERGGVLVGRVSPRALRFIIIGPKASSHARSLCEDRAKAWGTSVLGLRIGSRTFEPFFNAKDRTVVVWRGVDFQEAAEVCSGCGEPAHLSESGRCQWCDIPDEMARRSANRSALTASLALGIDKGIPLEFDGMEPRGYMTK